MSKLNITFAIQGFSNHHTLSDFPSMERLLKKARCHTHNQSFELTLFNLFGFNVNELDALPIAAVCGLAQDLPVQEGWWMRADPVALQADGSAVFLVGNGHLELTQAEFNSLCSLIKDYFRTEDIAVYTPNLYEWYLKLPNDPDVNTVSLNQVIGKNIDSLLPSGKNKKKWLAMMTELQMLCYSEPAQQQRVAQGKAHINSLWFWGNGSLPPVLQRCYWQKIWCKGFLETGLSQLNNLVPSTPLSFDDCLNNMDISGEYLIILDVTHTSNVEMQWFKPLLAAFNGNHVGQLEVYFDGKKYSLYKNYRWISSLIKMFR